MKYSLSSSLHENWDLFVTSLGSICEKDLTRVYLTGRLIEEEQHWLENSQSRGRDDLKPRCCGGMSQRAAEPTEKVFALKKCQHVGRNKRSDKKLNQRRGESQISVVNSIKTDKRDVCLLGSGANERIVNNPQVFSHLEPCSRERVSLANGQLSKVKGQCSVFIPCLRTKFHNVLYVPDLEYNLFQI